MKPITVRRATLNDLAALRVFEQGVINAERPYDVTIRTGHINYYNIEEFISSPHVELSVAEIDQEVIACGYARIFNARQIFTYEKYAYLGFMYVNPQYRGQGVINKIIEFLKAWAAEQNVSELRLDVYSENIAAVKAYQKIGFVNLMTEMRMPI